jgi:hypothetical protein
MSRRSRLVRLVLSVIAILALPAIGYAQEATISGTVTDTTGAVLPGVTVKAVQAATGNVFEAVTDGVGSYRLPVRVGVYQIQADLASFRTATRTGVEMLVGQQTVVNFQLALSTVAETVTVTAEAPLVNAAETRAAGNIDPRQMQELPVNGRNAWDLVMLAPGNRANDVSDQILGMCNPCRSRTLLVSRRPASVE